MQRARVLPAHDRPSLPAALAGAADPGHALAAMPGGILAVTVTVFAVALAAALSAALAAALSGCAELKHPDETPKRVDTVGRFENFHTPPFEQGRTLDTIISLDFNGSGHAEYVITSKDTASGMGRADLVTIFTYDTVERRYRASVNDPIFFADHYQVGDVTGDGRPDLVVHTWSGGNDVIASNGMIVYAERNGRLEQVYAGEHGDPRLESLPGVDGQAIVLHTWLWPDFMSHADAQEYPEDILGFRKGSFVSIRKEQSTQFRAMAQGFLDEYRTLRPKYLNDTIAVAGLSDSAQIAADSVTEALPHPLFVKAALALLMFGRGGERQSARAFWSSEREYLERRLPLEQMAELERIYESVVSSQ